MGYSEGKKLFENVTNQTHPHNDDGSEAGCVVGVTIIDDDTGKGQGIPLPVGEKVWLSEREMRLTASGPKDPSDNPFVNGDLREVVEDRPIPGITDRFIPVEGAVPPEPKPPEPEAAATDPEGLKGEQVSDELPSGALPPGATESSADKAEEAAAQAELAADEAELQAAKAKEVAAVAEERAAAQAKADDELRAAMAAEEGKSAEETAAADEAHTAEVGTAVKPQGKPAEGEFAKGEEVATPDAPSKGGKPGQKKG